MKYYNINLLILFCLSSFSLAYNYESIIEINDSQLPFSNSVSINLNLTQNATAYLKLIENNSNVTLNYPESLFFDTNIKNINISYSIPYFLADLNGNFFNVSFNITNNAYNSSFHYGILFKVYHTPLISYNSTNTLVVLESGYQLEISKDQLPYSNSVLFRLLGETGNATITKCEEWLQCPSLVQFFNNETTLNISYTIPSNISTGQYIKYFEITQKNISTLGNIKFTISEPDINIRLLNYTECGEPSGDYYAECVYAYLIKLREEQNARRLRLLNETNHTIYENVTIEKLVMVGSVDEEIKKLYDEIKAEANKLREEMNNVFNKNNELISKNTLLEQEMEKLKAEIELKAYGLEQNTTGILRKQRIIQGIEMGGVLLLLSGTILFIYANNQYKKYNLRSWLGR